MITVQEVFAKVNSVQCPSGWRIKVTQLFSCLCLFKQALFVFPKTNKETNAVLTPLLLLTFI